MSGYSNPILAMVATGFQPFSFYEELVTLFEKPYLNPISKGSTTKYDFVLEDTLLHENDSTFVISFAPLAGKNFEGLKGVISINSDRYAIENVIAEPVGKHPLIRFRIQQKYERAAGRWFPVQLQTDAEFTKLKLLGRNVIFSNNSYLRNINLSPQLKKEDFNHLGTQMAPGANRQEELAWQAYRVDPLSLREQNTYTLYDSLSLKKRAFLNNYMSFLEALLLNRFKAGRFDVLLDKLYAYNEYEGSRIGTGLQTNEDFSRLVQLGAYVGYGARDKALKYGGSFGFNLHPETETVLKLAYRNDVAEPGSLDFFRENASIISQEGIRDWFMYRMDRTEQLRAALSFRAFKYLQVQASLNRETRSPAYAYQYAPKADVTIGSKASFGIIEAGIGLRYAVKELATQLGRGVLVLKPAYPIFTFYAGRGVSGTSWRKGTTYHRLVFEADHAFHTKAFGSTALHFATGITTGRMPYPYLGEDPGGRVVSEQVSLFTPNHFQTMDIYEFLSDRYAYLFFTQRLGKLLHQSESKYFQPEVLLVQNIGFGTLRHPAYHHQLVFKTMEKGYFESGLMIDNLVRVPILNLVYIGVGGGAFYRYGPNASAKEIDNFAFKIGISITP